MVVARHGRTALNAAGALRGRLDPELDEVGLGEARRLGRMLEAHGVGVVVSSPLRRAAQTAEAVAAPLGLSVRLDPRFLDRDYGPWAGRPSADVEAEWGSVDRAPGVEPVASVLARAMQALAEVALVQAQGTVVVVSHDAVNRAVLAAIDPSLGRSDRLVQPTGCFNLLRREAGAWAVLAVDVMP